MGAKSKTVLKGFSYMQCDDFAKYLSDMAAKGWHFKEWGGGLKFEKGEPEKAVYAVEVFQKAGEDDMRPEPNTQEFAEYCESAGWKFVDAKRKFCIFKKIDQEATELFTPEERVDNALKSTVSGTAILFLVFEGLYVVLKWFSLNSMFSNIFSGSFFFAISVWTVLFMEQLLMLLYAVCKSVKLKKKVRAGEKIYIGNRQDGKYHINIKDIYMVLLMLLLMSYFFIIDRIGWIIFYVVIIVGTIGFSIIINKVRPERETYSVIQAAFAFFMMISIILFTIMAIEEADENSTSEKASIPLVYTDYREYDDVIEDTSYDGDRNFLGSVATYFVIGKNDAIHYDVYRSKYTWIIDKIWEGELEEKRFNEELVDCTADWGAKKALRNNVGTYYVRYDNSILVLSGEDVNLSEEQIDIILDKLEIR